MKFIPLLSATAALASAVPLGDSAPSDAQLEARQLGGTTRNDLEDGDAANCPSAILIFARGSTEVGNMGTVVGPPLAESLEEEFPDIWVQGVGDPYAAGLAQNALPKGTDQDSIDEAKRLFEMANTKCPDSAVVTAGYSQGTAVVGNALTESPPEIQDQVVGAVLFGYTKNQQNDGAIPDFPEEKTSVECRVGDAVCTGTLTILPAHFLYGAEARNEAPAFLTEQINGASAAARR